MSPTPKRLTAIRTKSLGSLAAGTLRVGESVDAAWEHLCEGLQSLASRGEADQLNLNVNGLTQRLCTELGRIPGNHPYFFQKEFMEDEADGNSQRVDVGIQARDQSRITVDGVRFAGGERFLTLEAKRLPAFKRTDEREYLTGQRGGVERFKKGEHGAKLKTVGMVGYIQRHSFSHWEKTINSWVDELIAGSKPSLPWDEKDRLEKQGESPRVARLQSRNLRVSDNRRLNMRHFWVQLAPMLAQLGSGSSQPGPKANVRRKAPASR